MVAGDENGKVKLAVHQIELEHLRQDINRLTKELAEAREDDRRWRQEMIQQFKWLSTQIVQLSNDHLTRIKDLEKEDAQKEERWAAHHREHAKQNSFQVVLSTVLSSAAAIFGFFFKQQGP